MYIHIVICIISLNNIYPGHHSSDQRYLVFFYNCVVFHYVCILRTLFNHAPTYGHLGGFQYFAITNSASKNNLMHKDFYVVGNVSGE